MRGWGGGVGDQRTEDWVKAGLITFWRKNHFARKVGGPGGNKNTVKRRKAPAEWSAGAIKERFGIDSLLRQRSADIDHIVGDHAKSDPALHAGIFLVERSSQPVSSF